MKPLIYSMKLIGPAMEIPKGMDRSMRAINLSVFETLLKYSQGENFNPDSLACFTSFEDKLDYITHARLRGETIMAADIPLHVSLNDLSEALRRTSIGTNLPGSVINPGGVAMVLMAHIRNIQDENQHRSKRRD